jgi:hypothetical protein
MIFNAKVMSTMLYGVQIWGWEKFEHWDWLQNEWQSLHVRTLKTALHLPTCTPDIPIYVESGMWPMMFYAIARTLRFAGDLPLAKSKWLDHLVALDLPHGFNERLGSLVDRLPISDDNEIDRLEDCFRVLLGLLANDPRDPDCPNRKVASYLSWVWNGQLHKRPWFYDMHLSPSQYRQALMTRLMMVDIPMFSRSPFEDRKCPLCQAQYGDLQHILLECPHFATIRQSTFHILGNQSPSLLDLFMSWDPTAHKYIADIIAQYRTATGR